MREHPYSSRWDDLLPAGGGGADGGGDEDDQPMEVPIVNFPHPHQQRQQPQQPGRTRNALARGVALAVSWGRENPVAAGWLGGIAFVLLLVYVQVIARLVMDGRGGSSEDGDGGSPVMPPPPAPSPAAAPPATPAPVTPASEPPSGEE